MWIPLDLIPVLDLLGGHVVRGEGGHRASYAPWISPLAGSSDPSAVADALLDLHPFRAVYLADLDAIMGRGDNLGPISELIARHPRVTFWLDQGLRDARSVHEFPFQGQCRPILGSESLADLTPLEAASPLDPGPILSLDFGPEGFRGPQDIFRATQLWPDTILLMTLERVGSDRGPDTEGIRELRGLAPDRHWYAAGGVRGSGDLERLSAAGARGALVASALHDNRLDAADLASMAG
ncbi:HisA/HisF-related TIM barrel protein [Thiohalorhabdus methylotrophus]|uniref:HisA/HisF-related TIM barrel protein n=1 Tax=Thiohalorhabdus methylotrophus TaxID=3242694 RepID=A0ABV4TX88_9GAMM